MESVSPKVRILVKAHPYQPVDDFLAIETPTLDVSMVTTPLGALWPMADLVFVMARYEDRDLPLETLTSEVP